jgi:hypothetical protein
MRRGRVNPCMLTAMKRALSVLTILLLACVSDAADRGQKEAAGARVYPFAMSSNGNLLTNPVYAPALLDAGADMVRIDVSFKAIRPTSESNPDNWSWKPLDEVRALHAKYPKLKFLVILGYGTEWAADPAYDKLPGSAIGSPQRGIDVRPVDDPHNFYGQYVYEAVRRYHDVVDAWESWNEPDLPEHHYFKGSGAQFMPYQRTFYLAAKNADPNCTALFAGLCFANVEGYLHAHHLHPPSPYPPEASFFEEYLQAIGKDPQAKQNNYYFDTMNQHTYSRASDLYDYTMVDRKLMQDYLGVQKPVWISEMGITDHGGAFGGTPQEYCDYVLQSYAWGSLAGVQKFFHFQLDNSNGHGVYSGMLGQPKPVLTTYRDVLVNLFADATLVKQLHGNAGVGLLEGNSPFVGAWRKSYDLFKFEAGGGRRLIYMAFTDSAHAVDITVPARAKVATLVDRQNDRHQLNASDGLFQLHLPGATSEAGWPAVKNDPVARTLGQPEPLVGGATIIVLEDVDHAP